MQLTRSIWIIASILFHQGWAAFIQQGNGSSISNGSNSTMVNAAPDPYDVVINDYEVVFEDFKRPSFTFSKLRSFLRGCERTFETRKAAQHAGGNDAVPDNYFLAVDLNTGFTFHVGAARRQGTPTLVWDDVWVTLLASQDYLNSWGHGSRPPSTHIKLMKRINPMARRRLATGELRIDRPGQTEGGSTNVSTLGLTS